MAANLSTRAELLAYVQLMARRPGLDAEMEDTDWYILMSAAQDHWYRVFCQHFPEVLMGAPALLTTADSGATYTFPSSVYPLGAIEIKTARDGALMKPGVEWDASADYVIEGDKIRIPAGKTRTFTSGPYARYVAMPAAITASVEPSLTPDWARVLIADEALVMWAERGGGQRNPGYYDKIKQRHWEGDTRIAGDSGIMGAIKTRFFGAGAVAFEGAPISWRTTLNTGT